MSKCGGEIDSSVPRITLPVQVRVEAIRLTELVQYAIEPKAQAVNRGERLGLVMALMAFSSHAYR